MYRTLPIYFLEHVHLQHPVSTEGPPPDGAPQPLNAQKTKIFYDQVENSFPSSIRGPSGTMPDVPERHWIDAWFSLSKSLSRATVTPHAAEAPEGAYRFRLFPEFDRRARAQLQELYEKPAAYGPASLPHRDLFLAQLDCARNPKHAQRAREKLTPSPCTMMDRILAKEIHRREHCSPLSVQRDAGRLEPLLPGAGARPVDPLFPYYYDVRDLREYERTKHRLRRFTWREDAEVLYMVLVCANWDHQAKLCAEDFKTFIAAIAKTTLEEKIESLQAQISETQGSSELRSEDPRWRELLQELETEDGGYCPREIRSFYLTYLENLEQQCQHCLARVSSGQYPEVKEMEPYYRPEAFWSSQTCYGSHYEKEMSTRVYEWRRFFRTITLPMPFNDTQLERRVKDTRLWIHRECTVEYHTTLKRNLVLDFEKFPVLHDPVTPPDATYHRVFSFALDWKAPGPTYVGSLSREKARASETENASPAPTLTEPYEKVYPSDTWTSIASRLGCTEDALREANPQIWEKHHNPIPTTPSSLTTTPQRSPPNTDPSSSLPNESPPAAVTPLPPPPLAHLTPSLTVPPSSLHKRPSTHPWLLPPTVTQAYLRNTRAAVRHHGLTPAALSPLPPTADKFPFEFRYGPDKAFPRAAALVPGEDSWQSYTRHHLDPELSPTTELAPAYRHNPHWPVQHVPGGAKDTPYEEDGSWMQTQQPQPRAELFHPQAWPYDMARTNREPMIRSMEWSAP